MGALILGYHSINYDSHITPENFEENLYVLKKEGFTPVTLQDIYDFIVNKKKIPKKSVHITLDDGYADNLIYAYPILEKYGFFATIFVIANKISENIKRLHIEDLKNLGMADKVTEFLEKSCYLSWEELQYLQQSKLVDIQSHSLNHKACFCSNKVTKFNDSNIGEWFFECTHDKRLGIPIYGKKWDCACDCLVDDMVLRDYMHSIVAKNNGILFFKNKNAQQILMRYYKKYMKKNSVSFCIEKTYERTQRLEKEVLLSKKVIEERLNKKVNFFCYPFGDFDDLSKEYIKRSYLAATTLKVGLNEPTVDTYELKRTRVRAGDWLERRLQIYRSGFLSRLYGRIYRNI